MMRAALLFTAAALLAAPTAFARQPELPHPDFTKGDPIPEEAVHDWNLGATGARGWMYSDQLETSKARQIYITKVAKGSPADGTLEVGDVILGVGNEKFSSDPRPAFGWALTQAESHDGQLPLLRWRDGATEEVTITLPVLGYYKATTPFHCSKSSRILEQGCDVLAKKILDGSSTRNPICRSLNGLALLASGNPKYLPAIREEANWASYYSCGDSRSKRPTARASSAPGGTGCVSRRSFFPLGESWIFRRTQPAIRAFARSQSAR